MKQVYQGIVERAADGTFWAYATEFPGATGSGDTPQEAQASLGEALRIWIEDARADGEEIPEPTTIGTSPVTVDAA